MSKERRRLKKIEKQIETNVKKAWYENGLLFLEIQEKKLHKSLKDDITFEDYMLEKWDTNKRQVYLLMDAARTYQILEKNPPQKVIKNGEFDHFLLPHNEAQIRPLVGLENNSQKVHVWNHLIESEIKPTMAAVSEAVKQFQAHPIDVEIIKETEVEMFEENVHVSNNSGENEWYTPVEFLDSARKTMGSIDLDPATCEFANLTVRADKIYTLENNGLEREWAGNVWMNPPYDKNIKLFAKKAVEERKNYSQLITLVNNATETAWFLDFVKIASAICFPSSRIKFIDKDGNPSGAPLQGQAILYVGNNVDRFTEEFHHYGFICTL